MEPIRILHGCHTPAEAENVTLNCREVALKLDYWFLGQWGFVIHSRTPEGLEEGDYDKFFDIYEELKTEYPYINFTTTLEANIILGKNGEISIDGNHKLFNALIASMHTTRDCGWDHNISPEVFAETYKKIVPQLQSFKGPVSLGHMMKYASGGNLWMEKWVDVVRMYAGTGIAVGIFLSQQLRGNPIWTEADLYHPTIGLTILQPWALKDIQMLDNLMLSLDWDAHYAEHLIGLNERNFELFCKVLKNERILSRFVV